MRVHKAATPEQTDIAIVQSTSSKKGPSFAWFERQAGGTHGQTHAKILFCLCAIAN